MTQKLSRLIREVETIASEVRGKTAREPLRRGPDNQRIGSISANIDGDLRYTSTLEVFYHPSSGNVTVQVSGTGAVGGMDYYGPGWGATRADVESTDVLRAPVTGRDLARAIRGEIRGDNILQTYAKMREFAWYDVNNPWKPAAYGVNVKNAEGALALARGDKAELSKKEQKINTSRIRVIEDARNENDLLDQITEQLKRAGAKFTVRKGRNERTYTFNPAVTRRNFMDALWATGMIEMGMGTGWRFGDVYVRLWTADHFKSGTKSKIHIEIGRTRAPY